MAKERNLRATSYAEAGYTLIKVQGKRGLKGWGTAKFIQPKDVATFLSKWKNNFGLALQTDQLVVDADPRNYKEGDDPLQRLFDKIGTSVEQLMEKTAIVKTGGGGAHFYFTKPKDLLIHKTLKEEYPGLDFLSKGTLVIGAGSIHPETKKRYLLVGDLKVILPAPQALLDIIKKEPVDLSDKKEVKDVTDKSERVVNSYIMYLKEADPAVEGESGDEATFMVCCKGRDFGLSRKKTLELLTIHFNPRCQPPWSGRALASKVKNAYEYASGKRGQALPQSDFDVIESEKDKDGKKSVWRKWQFLKKGSIAKKPNMNNVENYFLMSGCELKDSVQFDDFKKQIQITRRLPWHKRWQKFPKVWVEEDLLGFESWLSSEKWFDVKPKMLGRGTLSAAYRQTIHPLRDWLNALKWDGVHRTEHWLIKVAGAMGDREIVKAISETTLLQAVARVLDPGHQVDTITVLEGPQGIGKSKLVKILGGKYYSNILDIDPKNKDTILAMFGKWILEMGEMEVTRKADATALKNFISNRSDNIRIPYAAEAEEHPRQSIFIGTVNKDGMGEYLYDTTGNRRFMPVEIGLVNHELLISIRDQLFAEAVHLFKKGKKTYIHEASTLRKLGAEQKRRQATDPWESMVENYILKETPGFVKILDIWKFAMAGTDVRIKRDDQRRIANILKDLGYEHKTAHIENRTQKGFVHPEYSKNERLERKRKEREG